MKKLFQAVAGIIFLSTTIALAGPAFDVVSIDRDRILEAASHALTFEPLTITKYHAKLSTGGPHDYYSNGDYWWPNPNTTNGLPYVQRDGQSDTNNFNEDRDCVRKLDSAVAVL